MSDIYCLEDSYSMIQSIGKLVNREEHSNNMKHKLETSFLHLKLWHKTALYLIWNKPYMAAGKATFIGDVLLKMGLENVLDNKGLRYPEITIEQIKSLNPEFLFLSSEPFPFNEGHRSELKKQLPNTTVVLVDGEFFSWYGSRLLKSTEYFNKLYSYYLSY